MSTKPHRNTRLAQFVTRRVLELKHRKTQSQIAAEAGFVNANMLSMIKSGSAKLALDRVPALAEALECDAARLFRRALEQIENPTTSAAIQRIFRAIVTENEADWLEASPTAEAHIDRIPLCVALMHVAPRASDPKNMQHAVHVSSIVVRGPGLPTAFGGQLPLDDPIFHIREVASSQNRLLKEVLNQASADLRIHCLNRA